MTTTEIKRTGNVHAKSNKLDHVYQDFSVRETDDRLEYYHSQLGDWCRLPSEWADLVVWDLPKTVELLATEPNSLSHSRHWFVLATNSDVPIYSPNNSHQDESLKSCETWLANRGYKPRGAMPPECFEYDLS